MVSPSNPASIKIVDGLRILTLIVPIFVCSFAAMQQGPYSNNKLIHSPGVILIGLLALLFQLSSRHAIAKTLLLSLLVLSFASSTFLGEFYWDQNRFRIGWHEGSPVSNDFVWNTCKLRFALLILEMLIYYVIARLTIFGLFYLFRKRLLKSHSARTSLTRWFQPQFSIIGALWMMTLIALIFAVRQSVSDVTFDMGLRLRGVVETLGILGVCWTVVLLAMRFPKRYRHVALATVWIGISLVLSTMDFPYRWRLQDRYWREPILVYGELICISAFTFQAFLFWIEWMKLGPLLVDEPIDLQESETDGKFGALHPLES